MASLTLIVAATLTNGIGQSARLPWRLPQEMAYFARVTSSAPDGSLNAVIMGRNTWESIPNKFRPLRGRMNVVVSSNPDYLKDSPDIEEKKVEAISAPTSLFTNLSDAVESVTGMPGSSSDPKIHRCFVIGGASIYKATLNLSAIHPDSYKNMRADRILLTRILSPAFEDCDVFFPEFRDEKHQDGHPVWVQASHEELESWVGNTVPRGKQFEKGVEYEFQMWTRRD